MPTLATWRTWPVWARFLYGALLLYAALLCVVSLNVFISSLRQGWHLKATDIILQILMTLFLPLLILSYWKPRLASGLLFAAIAVDIGLLISLSASTGDSTAAMILGSLPFLGLPMLAAALLLHRLPRPTTSQDNRLSTGVPCLPCDSDSTPRPSCSSLSR